MPDDQRKHILECKQLIHLSRRSRVLLQFAPMHKPSLFSNSAKSKYRCHLAVSKRGVAKEQGVASPEPCKK